MVGAMTIIKARRENERYLEDSNDRETTGNQKQSYSLIRVEIKE
jgi:hypothetical protein